ncbi:MAG: hypothetical protein COB33_006760 [Thiotrichaceae bacterium]|nr:hypothetical protein [Thiotrichaceae bacterium]
MKSRFLLLSAVVLSFGGMLLSGCTTTPDETYKKSQMTTALDYPPDLVAPAINERFAVPPLAPPGDVAAELSSDSDQ